MSDSPWSAAPEDGESLWGGPAQEVDVSVVGGPGGVTLVEGSAFCISRSGGDIARGSTQGLYFRDTRFLSRWEVLVDGEPPVHLAFHARSAAAGTFLSMVVRGQESPRLLVERVREVGTGMTERVVLNNVSAHPTVCRLELLFDADFADLFEVKEARVRKAGFLGSGPRDGGIQFEYKRDSFRRGLEIHVEPEGEVSQREASFKVELEPHSSWSVAINFVPVIGHTVIVPGRLHHPSNREQPLDLESWRARMPDYRASVTTWSHLHRRAVDDLGTLRIRDPENPGHAVFAAGIPWFMTLFGRDSILASWQALMLDASCSISTLEVLARHQGIAEIEVTGESSGKILHEMRFGERAEVGGAPVYYGSVDATPLFVMLGGELLRFGADRDELLRLLPAIEDATDWVVRAVEVDRGGFVAYDTHPEAFLWNQGWKDSWDAVNFADGRVAQGPIALCEVQGYAYAALHACAELRDALNKGDGGELREFAADLAVRFRDRYWMEGEQFFCTALDGEGAQVDSVTSNPGHLLWTGILDDADAAAVARRLLRPDCFTGFGIRSLASGMGAYNPLSYHNGSVWPHDNAIAIAGMMRYGLVDEAWTATQALLAAAPWFQYRLPELYGGFGTREFPFPVPYPTACSPQAWAAGAPLMILRALLGFEPAVHRGLIHIDPHLPRGLEVEIRGLRLGEGRLSFTARENDVEILDSPPDVEVVIGPRSDR